MLNAENGRKKSRAAAKIGNDTVTTNQLSILSEAAVFYYNLSNACYKQYCHKKSLLKFQSDKEKIENGIQFTQNYRG